MSPLLHDVGVIPGVIIPATGDLNDWSLADASWIREIASSVSEPVGVRPSPSIDSGLGVELTSQFAQAAIRSLYGVLLDVADYELYKIAPAS